MWFFLSFVMAHATPSDALVEAASAAYGKPVPVMALCIKDVAMDGLDPLQVIGVTQRRAGCTLLGVWSNETLLDPADAAFSICSAGMAGLQHLTQSTEAT